MFEHWYRDEIGEAIIDDDIEAHNWLMAEHYDSGSDHNDGKLPEPCLRLDFGYSEFNSVELGDGSGFVRVDIAHGIIDGLAKDLATARNECAISKTYASKVRDLLEKVYGMAVWCMDGMPDDMKKAGDLDDMNSLYKDMQELGIEV